ncbi:MAG TPA: hypothetical protein VML92_03280 [Steroidobacteraceae bacterium]|nr:hypothetical protein [Steroidobacteraceae bacterium]
MISIKNLGAAFAFAALIGLAGCASQKEPAEQAMAELEESLKTSGAEIQKQLPERFAEIEAKVAELRTSMEQKSYRDVATGAAEAKADIKRAVADSRVARAQNQVRMEAEWDELMESMPKMIAAIDKKISAQGRKPPKGMENDAWKQLVASYDAARDAWGATAAGMKRETFEATVLAGRDAKVTIAGIMESLELEAS